MDRFRRRPRMFRNDVKADPLRTAMRALYYDGRYLDLALSRSSVYRYSTCVRHPLEWALDLSSSVPIDRIIRRRGCSPRGLA
jgi:hypothetical protein